MKIFELSREIQKALFDFYVQCEGYSEDDVLRNAKVTAFYVTELAKRWGDGRKMPIKKAVARSKKETRSWLRKKAQQNLKEQLGQSKELLELIGGAEAPEEEGVATPEVIDDLQMTEAEKGDDEPKGDSDEKKEEVPAAENDS